MLTVFSGYVALELLLVGAFCLWATRDHNVRQAMMVDEPQQAPSTVTRWCSDNCTRARAAVGSIGDGPRAKYFTNKGSANASKRSIVPAGSEPEPAKELTAERGQSAGGSTVSSMPLALTGTDAVVLDAVDVEPAAAKTRAERRRQSGGCCGETMPFRPSHPALFAPERGTLDPIMRSYEYG